MHTCIHAYTHTHIHAYTHTHTHTASTTHPADADGPPECACAALEAMQRAVTQYLFKMTNTHPVRFAQNIIDHLATIMTRSGWNSRFDAKYARRTTLTLDRPHAVWLNGLVTMKF